MGASKSNKTTDAQEKAASAPEEPQTVNDTPATSSSADNVLSTSEGQVVVGGVTVIEHEQDNGEASEAGGA